MKKLFLIALFPLVTLANVTITGTLPTTRVNGDPFTPTAGDTVNVSKNGGSYVAYTVTAAQVTAGVFTFVDTSSSNCKKDSWAMTYTATNEGTTSPVSPTYTTTVNANNCVVKFVPNATIN